MCERMCRTRSIPGATQFTAVHAQPQVLRDITVRALALTVLETHGEARIGDFSAVGG